MINATQIRKGMTIKLEGNLYKVLEAVHITPGRWKAMIQTKLRNLRDQSLLDFRFRSEDRIEQAVLEGVEMEFLYKSGEDAVFMNLENYEQIRLSPDIIGDGVKYLVPNIVFTVEMHEGKPVGVRPPLTVDLKVVETEPYLKGATQSATSKPATLETGLVVTVPQFIKEGDLIRVDTREDKYVERAKSA
ncbi:MAG: elongation factor P [Candidatus Aminicenantes bacterium]|nr:elongation factor P [Candidatus Aminicenantes bacterium]